MSDTWLSQEAYDRLQAEYEQLSGEGRTTIAKRIEAAREEGDLRENGGYHAAKEEQGKMEARIRQLRQLLDSAQVGEAPAADGTVKAGMVVGGDVRRRRCRRRHRAVPARLARAGRATWTSTCTRPSHRWAAPCSASRSARRRRTGCRTARTSTVRVDDAQPFAG